MIMKSIYRHIILALCIILASCSKDEAILVPDRPMKGDIQIIGAVMDFDNKTVGTKALGSEENEESLITEMAMFIFDKSGNSVTSGPVVIKNYNTNPDAFMIEIGDGEKGIIGTLNGQKYEYSKTGANHLDLEKCEIYIVANAEHYRKTDGSGNEMSVYDGITTLDSLLNQTLPLQGFEMPRNNGKKVGFPMIGTTNDGTTFNLLDAGANENTIATIPLKKLYSKVVVNISVHADQVSQEHTPKFELISWKVMDSPKQVKFGSDRSGYVKDYENSPVTNSATNQSITHTDSEILEAEPSDIISFTFYMPEHIVTPEGDYKYPDGILDNEKQRFKPDLLGPIETRQKGTYVQIEGTYYDHHGQIKQAKYRLYLGQNNTDDFKIIRNQQLNNYITIRGMTNSTSAIGPNGETNISVDHRVDVENEGLSIAIERETLMDAHFEFRPVDVTLSANSSLTVSIPEKDRSWIAIEKSQPSGSSHVSGVGIRKYFTTNLISALTTDASDNAGPVLTYENNSSVPQKYRFWIYVDENPNVYDKTVKGKVEYGTYTVSDTESRFGNVQFVYTDAKGEKTIDYNIEQRNLWRIWNGDCTRYYDIEYHEEYLYNYAADDPYGQTTDGIKWGLNGSQLSNEHDSFKCNSTIDSWLSYIEANPMKYDFYIGKHDSFANDEGGEVHNFAGQEFTREIYTKSNGGIKNLTMADQPNGAVEYCYNRNKRDVNGKVEEVEWYLPSADEMEDIIVAGYSSFHEFQDKYYWTSQPAYIRNAFYYEYRRYSWSQVQDTYAFIVYEDNPYYARATKVVHGNDGFDYAKSGLKDKPDNFSDIDDTDGYGKDCENLGCFYEMPYWKSGKTGTFKKTDGGDFNGDQEFTEKRGGTSTNIRYHVHLGHLDDMMQEGYQKRTNINRVRCVYRSGTN